METWQYRHKSYLYYDWMTRDFFTFLAIKTLNSNTGLRQRIVYRSGPFQYKARQAELRAREAITYQTNGNDWSAKQKYRDIYGTSFPQ
jgi:hypothetical protein